MGQTDTVICILNVRTAYLISREIEQEIAKKNNSFKICK